MTNKATAAEIAAFVIEGVDHNFRYNGGLFADGEDAVDCYCYDGDCKPTTYLDELTPEAMAEAATIVDKHIEAIRSRQVRVVLPGVSAFKAKLNAGGDIVVWPTSERGKRMVLSRATTSDERKRMDERKDAIEYDVREALQARGSAVIFTADAE